MIQTMDLTCKVAKRIRFDNVWKGFHVTFQKKIPSFCVQAFFQFSTTKINQKALADGQASCPDVDKPFRWLLVHGEFF